MAEADFFVQDYVFGGGNPTPCAVCPYPKPNVLKDYFTLENTGTMVSPCPPSNMA